MGEQAAEDILRDREPLTIEFRDPTELTPHPQNVRSHPPEQLREIQRRLRDLGQYKNVVVTPDGTILAGHGVVQAALELGWQQIAVGVFDGTDAEAKLLMLGDNEVGNPLSEVGPRDDEAALLALAAEVQAAYGSLAGTGISEADLKRRREELEAAGPPEDFPEYDENLDVSGIRTVECPECGHEFPV